MLIAERIPVSPLSARHDGGVSPQCEGNATMINKEDRRGHCAAGDSGGGARPLPRRRASGGRAAG
jgi:hypothetical protein